MTVCRTQRAQQEREYDINGEVAAILTGDDPISHIRVCLDGTRTFNSLGRLVMVEGGEEEGNVLAFCAVLRGELKVGFLATRAIQQEERVMCTEV